MALSLRLRTLCSLLDIQDKGGLVDVGYDHGQILHWASEQQMSNLFGVEKADHFKQRYGQHHPYDDVQLFTGDGLHPLPKALRPGTLLLTGLGEQQIRRILDENKETWSQSKQIIFSPSSIDLCLRGYLNDNGWYMRSELLVKERKKLYVISVAEPGAEHCLDARQRALGPRLFEEESPLLVTYLSFVDKRLTGK